ncbi:hypothetical protein KAW38_03300 [Candidatus Micrarchaeota archaeon]|nr:hypothetical protein [Candidatus Micrarchaeota archaeon]
MTDFICDSSSLISFTDSCLVKALSFLKSKGARFFIPPSVLYESVTHPLELKMRAYRFSAIKLKDYINKNRIEVVKLGEDNKRKQFMKLCNELFYARGRPLKLVHLGEAEMIMLAKETGVKNLMMDERTTRLIIEDPMLLKEHLQKELRVNIMANKNNLQKIHNITQGMKIFRSTEILAYAYEKGFFKSYGELEGDAVESALYSLKYSGCSIGFNEIEEYVGEI